MLVISTSFAVLSLLLTGDIFVNAKPHHSPLGRRLSKHRRRGDFDSSHSPPSPPNPLVGREDSGGDTVWVDVTSTTTVTASRTQPSHVGNPNNGPPPVVGAILAGQDGNSEPEIITVDVTSTVYKTVKAGGGNQYVKPTQQVQPVQNKPPPPPPATTITATQSNGVPIVGAIAISTGKGITTTISNTWYGPAATGIVDAQTGDPNVNTKDIWLAEHNRRRQIYGNVPALVWDEGLVYNASINAGYCNKTHFKAAENLQWGNNIGTPQGAVKAWVDDEEPLYDFDRGEYSDETGHFTQVVWRDTQRVGCWIARCGANSAVAPGYDHSFQTACEYEPAGNFLGQQNFLNNVYREGSTYHPKDQDPAEPQYH